MQPEHVVRLKPSGGTLKRPKFPNLYAKDERNSKLNADAVLPPEQRTFFVIVSPGCIYTCLCQGYWLSKSGFVGGTKPIHNLIRYLGSDACYGAQTPCCCQCVTTPTFVATAKEENTALAVRYILSKEELLFLYLKLDCVQIYISVTPKDPISTSCTPYWSNRLSMTKCCFASMLPYTRISFSVLLSNLLQPHRLNEAPLVAPGFIVRNAGETDPILVLRRYAAYLHFKALGWAVHSGLKIGADMSLYALGGELSHASYAVILSHHFYDKSQLLILEDSGSEQELSSWLGLLAAQRLSTHTAKNVLLCKVFIPSELRDLACTDQKEFTIHPSVLDEMLVHNTVVKRWSPHRDKPVSVNNLSS